MSNAKKVKRQPPPPDADERAFRDELRKGCPGCGSKKVSGRWDGRWRYTLHCDPQCASWTGRAGGFTGHTIGAEAAKRAGMVYRAIDGTTGGVVIAAGSGMA